MTVAVYLLGIMVLALGAWVARLDRAVHALEQREAERLESIRRTGW